MAVIVLLANGLLQQMVQPIAFGATLELNPLVVLIATIAGGCLFGMLGLILCAPLVSAAVHIARRLSGARARPVPAEPEAPPACAGGGSGLVTAAPPIAPPGMAWIPGGAFRMGSEDFYPEERPVREVAVGGFWMDEHPVTVAEFRRFVKATGYVTVAERPLDPALYPDADPEQLSPGSLVFRPTRGPVPLDDYRAWWAYVPGACWRRPEGPGSDTYTRARHPVVHIAHEDALAYARWAGRALPTEAEWERAARGGLDGATFAWGDDQLPGGRHMANTWQGEFPWRDLRARRPRRHLARRRVPAQRLRALRRVRQRLGVDGRPLPGRARPAHGACCAPAPEDRIPRMVIKGGSHLCAPSYCLRYRPRRARPRPSRARRATSASAACCARHSGAPCGVLGVAMQLPPPDPNESFSTPPDEDVRMPGPDRRPPDGPAEPRGGALSKALLDWRPGALIVVARH